MNIFGKTVMDTCSILNECGDIEDSYVDSIFSQDLLNDFVDTFACLDEIEEDYCVYAPQAAVVFENNGTYYIELEQVAKVADYNEVSLEEAIDMIAEADGIDVDNMAVVVESDDLISMIIAESKCAKGSKLEEAKAKGMKKTTDAVNKLKEKVKVVKKPAKKGSKVGKKDKKNKKKDEDDDI